MYVIPAEGLTVPDPVLRDHLPPEGREVTPSEYWIRRIADGDVKEGKPPAAVTRAAEAAEKADADRVEAERQARKTSAAKTTPPAAQE
jgi:hypothetical protein